MYAASAVINMPIVSHHPSSSELLTAWSRRVVGRGVKDMATDVRILWSSGSAPDTAATFTANHFGTGKRRRLRTQELATMKPALLDNHVPLKVFGDGNCLYRALSRALYGTEERCCDSSLRLKYCVMINCMILNTLNWHR